MDPFPVDVALANSRLGRQSLGQLKQRCVPWSKDPFTRSSSTTLLLFLFLREGSPTKIDYRKKGTLILTSNLSTGGPSC